MEDKPSPLSDLSFFRFPENTTETIASIIALFVLLGLTVLATVLIHRIIRDRHDVQYRRKDFDRVSSQGGMADNLKATLDDLVRLSPLRDGFDLVRDAMAYELAVARKVREDPQADLDALARLRRTHRLNVMNSNLTLVSTRQLLRDLPVRLIAKRGEECLDLYCALMDVNEGYLLIDVPPDKDIRATIQESEETQLIFWRDDLGETVFPIQLDVMPSGDVAFYRSSHVFRDEAAAARADFRLSVNFPLQYRYVERDKLGQAKAKRGAELGMLSGEGHLIDLSYGGAAFATADPLSQGGLAQLKFSIHDKGVHLMLEVLSHARLPDGRWRHHGQFRGMSAEVRTMVNHYISREQVVRLREKEAFRKGQSA